jgi:hypothetical protein
MSGYWTNPSIYFVVEELRAEQAKADQEVFRNDMMNHILFERSRCQDSDVLRCIYCMTYAQELADQKEAYERDQRVAMNTRL